MLIGLWITRLVAFVAIAFEALEGSNGLHPISLNELITGSDDIN